MRKNIWLALLLVGCSQEEVAVVSNPAGFTVTVQDVTDKQNAILTAISGNTAAISQVKTKIESLEASLAKSEPQNGKDGDPASALNPPAKANTALDPLKVATPGASRITSDGTVLRWDIAGNWNPTILETSAHLRTDHGVDTNGMTHQQMAGLHDGKPMPVSTSRKNAGAVSSCPGGTCPTNRTHRRGLFGWRR